MVRHCTGRGAHPVTSSRKIYSVKRVSLAKLSVCLMAAASVSVLAAGSVQAQETITFEQILANPSDKQLNIDYAQQEAAAGNLLGAAATLERLLLNEPNWDDVRLFYAAVLFRLGDYQGAEREVRILEERPLSPDLREQLEDFKDKLRGEQSRSNLSGSIAFGVTYDGNVAVNTADPNVAASDTNDYGITGRLRVKYEYEIGGPQDVSFVAFLSTYSKLYEDFGQVDFNFITGRTGLEGSDGPYEWRVLLDVKNLDIAGDQYLKEYGVSSRLRRELTPSTTLQLSGDYSNQEYDNIVIGSLPTIQEDQRSGLKYSGIASLNHKFTAQISGTVGLGYQRKKAEYNPYSTDSLLVTAALSRSFRNGAYALVNYFYRDVEYDEADFLIVDGSQGPREEERRYSRGAVGIPIGAIIKTENDNLQDTLDSLNIEFSVFHDKRSANYDVYDFENTGGELQLIWQFD